MDELRPRIAFFMPSLRGGGVERTFVNLSNELARRGHIIDLVVGTSEGPNREILAPEVHLVDLNRSRISSTLFALARYLRQRKPKNLISAMEHTSVAAIVSAWLARTNTRTIACVHHTMSVQYSVHRSLKSDITLMLARGVYRKADRIVAVSAGCADDAAEMLKMDRNRIEVIYNPTVTPQLFELSREAPNHPWLIDHSEPVILSIGRLNVHKDFETLIRAFAIVRSDLPCRLIVLGEGELREDLESLCSELGVVDYVSMPGYCANPYAFLRVADVFAMSSISEGLPGALIEALALGIPIVSTDCKSGPKEILENGKWGRLVPVGGVEAMAKAIMDQIATGRCERSESSYAPYALDTNSILYERLTADE